MKKIIGLFSIFMLTVIMLFAQSGKGKVEVLYFKANLACCKARSCNALSGDIQMIIQKNFADSSVTFKEIILADEANKELVTKYNAQSQTVVLLKIKKKQETSIDVSDIVKTYVQNQNKEILEQSLLAKITEIKKKK